MMSRFDLSEEQKYSIIKQAFSSIDGKIYLLNSLIDDMKDDREEWFQKILKNNCCIQHDIDWMKACLQVVLIRQI